MFFKPPLMLARCCGAWVCDTASIPWCMRRTFWGDVEPDILSLRQSNIAGCKILMFNRKYLFNPGPAILAMLGSDVIFSYLKRVPFSGRHVNFFGGVLFEIPSFGHSNTEWFGVTLPTLRVSRFRRLQWCFSMFAGPPDPPIREECDPGG